MNIKNMCCNQFGERHIMQAEIDRLEAEVKQLKAEIEQILNEEDEGVEE